MRSRLVCAIGIAALTLAKPATAQFANTTFEQAKTMSTQLLRAIDTRDLDAASAKALAASEAVRDAPPSEQRQRYSEFLAAEATQDRLASIVTAQRATVYSTLQSFALLTTAPEAKRALDDASGEVIQGEIKKLAIEAQEWTNTAATDQALSGLSRSILIFPEGSGVFSVSNMTQGAGFIGTAVGAFVAFGKYGAAGRDGTRVAAIGSAVAMLGKKIEPVAKYAGRIARNKAFTDEIIAIDKLDREFGDAADRLHDGLDPDNPPKAITKAQLDLFYRTIVARREIAAQLGDVKAKVDAFLAGGDVLADSKAPLQQLSQDCDKAQKLWAAREASLLASHQLLLSSLGKKD